ncbi:nucleotidyltransferase [Oscillatoria amoena NRMC-F 0135]|nr:nucleotidyltransferase [Oscillatoria amoena NRMC-F 0135]
MIFTGDLLSLLRLLNEHRVEYMVIGGAAVNIHGFSRSTGDMDIWFNPTQENFEHLHQAIEKFGFEVPDEFRKLEYIRSRGLIRLPLEKFYVEFLADVGAKFRFEELYPRCEVTTLDEDLELKVIGYSDLISLKLSVHRAKDLEDVKNLERVRNKAGRKSNLYQKLVKRLSDFWS